MYGTTSNGVSVCKVYDRQMYPLPRIGILGRLFNQAGQDLACGAPASDLVLLFLFPSEKYSNVESIAIPTIPPKPGISL